MIQGAAPAPAGTSLRPAGWVQQHPGILVLLCASLVGLIVLPAIGHALTDHDVMIDGRISLIDVVWLVAAVALCVICLGARASMSKDLGDGLRRLLAGSQTKSDNAPRSGSTNVDVPALGAAIVRGVFDLAILLVIQGIVRVPLVGVVGAFEPPALVDGIFVALVVVIALFQLFALYGVVQPLTLRLVTVGLDRLVPTAGFAAGALPDAPATRTLTGAGAGRTARGAGQPTVAAASGSDLPTVAAGATVAAAAEATVMAPPERVFTASEATVLEPPRETSAPADETVAQLPSRRPSADESSDRDRTVAEERTLVGDATVVSTSQEGRGSDREPHDGSEGGI